MKSFCVVIILFFVAMFIFSSPVFASRRKNLSDFQGRPPIHIIKSFLTTPQGLTPDQVKNIYGLPSSGGSGTIAIVDAYDYPTAENDLHTFSQSFHLPDCTSKNGCFEIHKMATKLTKDSGWDGEQALDIEWAHAIAPQAKILLVEAKSASGPNLLSAVNYAQRRQDIIALSLSWGGPEYATETNYDKYFVNPHVTIFVAAGDNGAGVQWPAASPNVIAVGGTKLELDTDGSLSDEIAWTGSGGGVSLYEKEPGFQIDYEVPDAKNMRAVPDVAYNADPASGYAMYDSTANNRDKGWFVVGGTSAGAPQWAAIRALGNSFGVSDLYAIADSKKGDSFFRDILSGKNGTCRYYCKARKGYDFVTGLGSPLTINFSK